jgi:hypothetical protein
MRVVFGLLMCLLFSAPAGAGLKWPRLYANPFTTGKTFYWNLEEPLETMPANYDIYDLDLDEVEKSPDVIQALKRNGKKIICYFSAGTIERTRTPNRYATVSPASIGKRMKGWDEKWLDIRQADVRKAQVEILKAASAAGCDAVEPDNLDAYENDSGFALTAQDHIDYLKWLSDTAHNIDGRWRRGLFIGLKNVVSLVQPGQLQSVFDFVINEQCYTFDECEDNRLFTAKNKAVFIIDYKTTFESKPYNMKNFAKDCLDAQLNSFYFMVYKTQHVDGNIVAQCPLN